MSGLAEASGGGVSDRLRWRDHAHEESTPRRSSQDSGGNVKRRVREIEAAAEMLELAETTRRTSHRRTSTTDREPAKTTTTTRKRTATTIHHTSHSSDSKRGTTKRTTSTSRRTVHKSTSHAHSTSHTTHTPSSARTERKTATTRRSSSPADTKSTTHTSSRPRSTAHSTSRRSTTVARSSPGRATSSSQASAIASSSQSSISFAQQASTSLSTLSTSSAVDFIPTTSALATSTLPTSTDDEPVSSSIATSTVSATSVVSAAIPLNNTVTSRISKGGIAGATLGSLIGAGLFVLLGLCLLSRRRRRRQGESGDWGAVASSGYEYERDMRQTGSVLWGAPGALFGGAGRDSARSRSSFIAGPRWSARDDELDPLTAPGNMSPVDREFPAEAEAVPGGYSAPFAAYAPVQSPKRTSPTTPTDWTARAATEAGIAAPPAALASPHRMSGAAPAGLLAALFGYEGLSADSERQSNRTARQEGPSREDDEADASDVGGTPKATQGGGWAGPGARGEYATVAQDSPTRGPHADYSSTQPLRWNRKPSTPDPMPALLTPDEEQDGTLDTHREAWLWASAGNRVSEMGLVRANPKRGSLVDRRINSVRTGRSASTEGSAYSGGGAGSGHSHSSRGGTPNTSELFYTTPHWTGTKVGPPKPVGARPARRRVKLPSLTSTSSSPFVSRAMSPAYPVVLPPSPPQSFESQKRSDTPGGGTIDRIAASFAGALGGLGRPVRGSQSSHHAESLISHSSVGPEHEDYPGLTQPRLAWRPGTPPAGLALNGPRGGGNRSPHGGLALPAMAPFRSPASSQRTLSGLGHGQYRTPWTRAGEGPGEGWAGIAARQGPVSPPRPPKSELRKVPKPPQDYLSHAADSVIDSPPLSSPERKQLPSPLFPNYASYFTRSASHPTEQPFTPPTPDQASDQRRLTGRRGAPDDDDDGRITSPPPALPLPPPPAPGKRWTLRRGTLGGESDDGAQAIPPMWRSHSGTGASEGGSRNQSVSSQGWQTDGSSGAGSWGSGGQEGGDEMGWEEVDVGVPVRRD